MFVKKYTHTYLIFSKVKDLNFSDFEPLLNPFHATGIFPYPQQISQNLLFSDVFRKYRKRSVL